MGKPPKEHLNQYFFWEAFLIVLYLPDFLFLLKGFLLSVLNPFLETAPCSALFFLFSSIIFFIISMFLSVISISSLFISIYPNSLYKYNIPTVGSHFMDQQIRPPHFFKCRTESFDQVVRQPAYKTNSIR